ncbi:unnamed protein product [Durusdinium trenchii]|uniref:Uncharacterized protein n=1 Tax=Durusdinium trenchii TaxID=1381693 RepID=A0ABP0JS79_9DINO
MPASAESLVSVSSGGEKPRLAIDQIHKDWERADALRSYLREDSTVIFKEGVSENVKTCSAEHIHAYLTPLVVKMAATENHPQPNVDPLRDEISKLYMSLSKQVGEDQIVLDSWMTRKYLGFIKMKCRLRKPSKERNFQNLCLLLNPDLQACVDEINHKETEKMLAKKKESVKDPDAYDDGSSSSSSDDEPCESDGDASVHEEIRGKEIPESLPEPDKVLAGELPSQKNTGEMKTSEHKGVTPAPTPTPMVPPEVVAPAPTPTPMASPGAPARVSTTPPGDATSERMQDLAAAKKRLEELALLVEAAKARLRRMCAKHKTKRSLDVPEFVVEQWRSNDQTSMARLLMENNWSKESFIAQLEIIVRKKATIKVSIEEMWVSEQEMRDDLRWKPPRIAGAKKACEAKRATHIRENDYDGVTEYYVKVREKGLRDEEQTQEEIHRKLEKVTDGPVLDDKALDGLERMKARQAAVAAEPGTKHNGQEAETKLALKRFLDSLLQKSGKIRGLIRELSEQYSSADSTASNVAKLREQLKLMDSEYDSCQSVQVYGEINNWNAEFVQKATKAMNKATETCSKAVGLEMKIRSAKKYEKKDPGSEKAKEKKEKKDKKRDKKEKTGKAKADGTEGEGATSSASRPKRLRRMEA